MPIYDKDLLNAAERAAVSKREALSQYQGNFVNLNNHHAHSNITSKDIDAIERDSDDVNRVFTEQDVDLKQTWLDLQFEKQHKKDVEALSSTKERIIREFSQLKGEVITNSEIFIYK